MSLLGQTHKPYEIIVVASYIDTTSRAIEDLIYKKRVIYIKVKSRSYIRDAHFKRWLGANRARGEYIFFTDSKAILDRKALQKAILLAKKYKVEAVAGIAKSWKQDENLLVSKLQDKGLIRNNPKFPKLGKLNIKNIGRTESLPVTTALLISKDAFKSIKGDFGLEYSKVASTYDDYVTAWLLAKEGYEILLTNRIISYHKHRNWKQYFKQIARSGQSAALMLKYYPDCPYGKRRAFQVFTFSALNIFLLAVTAIFIIKLYFGWLFILVFGTGLALIIAGIINVLIEKDIDTFFLPPFTYALICTFSIHYLRWFFTKTKNYKKKIINYFQLH